jgi:hypothetical protein
MKKPERDEIWVRVCREIKKGIGNTQQVAPSIETALYPKGQGEALALVKQIGGTTKEDLNKLDKPVIQVNLRDCRELSDTGLAEIIIAFPSLEDLILTGCEKITDDGLAMLKGHECLKILRLHNTLISDLGVEHLTDVRLDVLDLDRCQGLTDEGLRHIGLIRTLRELYIQLTSITDRGLPFLQGLTKLRRLDLNKNDKDAAGDITDAGLESLTPLVKLERLNLQGTKVTDPGICKLRKALPGLRDVTRPDGSRYSET